MAEGKIHHFTKDGSGGLIQPDEGGELVYFRVNWVKSAPAGGLKAGMRLAFESEPGDRGQRTRWVRFIASQETPGDKLPARSAGGYRFLNPYNFVRSMHAPDNVGVGKLMARCAPPPHDRWVGWNGTITCKATAVSPLFIADARAGYDPGHPQDEEAHHRTYQFFKLDFGQGPEPALPASSLRGMLRNVFEAATNSCYAHLEYGRRLSRHLPAAEALLLTPGKVARDPDGTWWLEILSGTARLAVGERPRDKLYPARVEKYKALKPPRPRQGSAIPPLREVDLNGLGHGNECFALVEEKKFPPVWDVLQVSRNRMDLERQRKGTQKIFKGYLCLNNQNIETKRFERFFFRDPQNTLGANRILLLENVRKEYEDLIHDYQLRHEAEMNKWQEHKPPYELHKHHTAKGEDGQDVSEPAFSRFIIDKKSKVLKDGDLVYAMFTGTPTAPNVQFIAPVAVPRVSFKRKIDDLLPMHLHKCSSAQELCPACRMFGWVYGQSPKDEPPADLQKATAYRGRLRFSPGRLTNPAVTLQTVELAILGSPKPTTTRFYLRPKVGKPQSGLDDQQAGYDNNANILRGRKVYRHQGRAGNKDYWLNKEREYFNRGKRSDQNRSLADALAPGAEFTFQVHFENLAESELGALLWAIALEGRQYHRLGYAKPLGFGSLKLEVQEVEVLEPQDRYGHDLAAHGKTRIEAEKLGDLISPFKTALENAYSEKFDQLSNIHDLLSLLSDPAPDLPIHYPRTTQNIDPKGKNFEWFMGNTRNKNARFTLELPGEEKGFPLIDKTGKIQG